MTNATRPRTRVSVVGVIGEVLLTAGVLILLYLAWQLWWNDMVSANAQQQTATSLSQSWQDDATASPSPEPSPEPTDAPTPTTPAVDPAVTATPTAGKTFATLYVPRFGADYVRPVLAGIGTDVLKHGVGYYTGTQLPGQVGNFALAAHRKAYGAAFDHVTDLRLGDAIVVETPEGWYTYRFRNLEYVRPTGVGVIAPVPQDPTAVPTDRLITLTTCNPRYTSTERVAAYGEFESFTPRAAGPPDSLAPVADSFNEAAG